MKGDAMTPPAGAHRVRVLVVDDNADAADSLMVLLQLCGYDAEAAHGGRAALRALADRPPDAVLCDLAMPGMSGFEVAARLRATGPLTLLLVAVTAYSDDDVRQRAREAGFDHFAVKPADPEFLLQLLRAHADLPRSDTADR
jgi:CheY-like chemotaxis protein